MKPHESPRIRKNQFVVILAIRGLCGIGVLDCWGISQFLDFSQDMRALPEACTGAEPAREIRGGLHQ